MGRKLITQVWINGECDQNIKLDICQPGIAQVDLGTLQYAFIKVFFQTQTHTFFEYFFIYFARVLFISDHAFVAR